MAVFLLFFFILSLSAQCDLRGTVTDAQGNTLIGANIYAPELQKGAVSDGNGIFSLGRLPAGDHLLTISYVGYETVVRKISADEDCELTIVLQEDRISTGEVIVSATRADERVPMTYTNLKREELEQNNLGQDVPFLLRWTPSAVVTSDAGTGIGYTGIWIRGTDPYAHQCHYQRHSAQ